MMAEYRKVPSASVLGPHHGGVEGGLRAHGHARLEDDLEEVARGDLVGHEKDCNITNSLIEFSSNRIPIHILFVLLVHLIYYDVGDLLGAEEGPSNSFIELLSN